MSETRNDVETLITVVVYRVPDGKGIEFHVHDEGCATRSIRYNGNSAKFTVASIGEIARKIDDGLGGRIVLADCIGDAFGSSPVAKSIRETIAMQGIPDWMFR